MSYDPEPADQQSPQDVEKWKRWHLELDKLLAQHLGTDGPYDYDWLGHLLDFDYNHEIPNVWSKKDCRFALDQLELAIDTIDSVFVHALPVSLYGEMLYFASKAVYPHQEEPDVDNQNEGLRENSGSSHDLSILDVLLMVSANHEALRSMINRTRPIVEEGLNLGNKDIEAWRLVAAAAKLCSVRYKGTIRVPNTMNESGPFYRLLVDLFHFFELDGSPVAAFKAWVRYVESSEQRELLDYRSDHVDRTTQN